MHDDNTAFGLDHRRNNLKFDGVVFPPRSDPRPVLSIVGLGKLGAPMAACFASKEFRTIGVDTDPAKVLAVNQGRAPVEETDLAPAIAGARSMLSATTDLRQAVVESDVTFIIVPTPSEADGSFSLRYVLPVCKAIGNAVREKKQKHLVCLCSTVMPGATGGPVREMLEVVSGKTVGVDLGLCYSPEFIALGSVIHDFLNPDFLLIGESDRWAGDLLEHIYRLTLDHEPRFARMNFVNAEIAKIAVNSFVTTKITYANMIAGICQRTADADVDTVTQAVGLDSRIGPKYLKGAVGFGGPCFPRDNIALAHAAELVGAQADLARTVDAVNRLEVKRLAQLVINAASGLRENDPDRTITVGVLGLSYKPDTDVIEQSQGIILAEMLSRKGVNVIAHDPAAMPNAHRKLGEAITTCATLDECANRADIVVLVTPWKAFARLPEIMINRMTMQSQVIIDCWRLFDQKAFAGDKRLQYIAIGVGPDAPDEQDQDEERSLSASSPVVMSATN